MPVSRSTMTRSVRTDEQHPYSRPPEPLVKLYAYREPVNLIYKDPRENTSPKVVNSQSLLNPTFSEQQTWAKMGTTLIREVQSSKLANVPKLAEDLLPEEAISNGMAKAKGDDSFRTTFAGIVTAIRDVPLRIGKYIAVNFWQGRREDVVEPEITYAPIKTETGLTIQAMKVDETTTVSSDQDSQATLLDENKTLAWGSDGDTTKVGDDSDTPSTADLKKDKEDKKDKKGGRKGKKADDKDKKPLSSEEETAIFLNRIADQIREVFGIDTKDPKKRVFSARFKDKAPDDAPINCIRKPDCAVLDYDVSIAEKARWSEIHSLIEIKKSSAFPVMKDAYNELLSCARMVFAAQHNRRFVLGATISGTEMILFVFDRSGVVGSKTFDINKEPEFLVRVICGFIFVDNIRLGFDTTIKKKGSGRGYTIRMNGIDFDCEEPMYIEKAVRGRGTGCFKTSHDGDDAVIKDSWVDESRKKLEHEILEKVKDVEGVVRVIDHAIVQVEGKDDSTSVARRRLAENDLWKEENDWKGFNLIEARTHRRILLKPYGQPLESFANLKELMLAIKDIVKIIEDLIERKVLHRDISLRNLILARSDPNDPNSRIRGYLIDFDYALDLENISEDVAKGARTGTLPFMAIEMLVEQTNNKVPHAYYHDLESVFYSLCWLCTSQEGPNNTPRCSDTFKFSESTVAKWNGIGMDNPVLEDIRSRKAATVRSKGDFATFVLHQFAPYFNPLKPCITALRKIMVNENSNLDELEEEDREEIEEAKYRLEWARRNGRPVDKTSLSIIPNSERDHRDVFNSIYETIDKCINDLKEPKIPDACKNVDIDAEAEERKKPSREEIDYNQPRGVRDFVDRNEEERYFRAKAVAEAKIKETNEKIDSGYPLRSGIVLFGGHSQPETDIPTDNEEDEDMESQCDESDFPSPKIGQRMVAGTSELPPPGMATSRPFNISSAAAPHQPKSLDPGLLPSPLIKRRSNRTKRSTSSSNMPPPSTPGRANVNLRASHRRTMTPSSLSIHHSPPSSAWSVSSKRSASEFEDDESGQRTPTHMSPPKKQKLR